MNELATTLRKRYGLACEAVYVDDGSSDDALGVGVASPADALDVQVVSLSRNFGKEAALMAGLDHARRGAVLFMDGDGQHPPDWSRQLVGHWIEGGYDVATPPGQIATTNPAARLAVRGFYALINWGARQKIPEDAATSACCRRARQRHSGSCRSATVSSRGWRAGSASARSASITNPPRAPMA